MKRDKCMRVMSCGNRGVHKIDSSEQTLRDYLGCLIYVPASPACPTSHEEVAMIIPTRNRQDFEKRRFPITITSVVIIISDSVGVLRQDKNR